MEDFINQLISEGFSVGWEDGWHKVEPYENLSHSQRVTLSLNGQEISDYLKDKS